MTETKHTPLRDILTRPVTGDGYIPHAAEEKGLNPRVPIAQ